MPALRFLEDMKIYLSPVLLANKEKDIFSVSDDKQRKVDHILFWVCTPKGRQVNGKKMLQIGQDQK